MMLRGLAATEIATKSDKEQGESLLRKFEQELADEVRQRGDGKPERIARSEAQGDCAGALWAAKEQR
ncbi:fatty acid synthase [Coraliomargarita akajimensis DSM 45221]|uniref:Fatty acid synthase n=1 Tax=Coraliomargarita akajimensis (strain DSM 45221 / IAM 15411 / JCM 23193 / KCTC 12865 / 04OKA010-24) TaxID=583355 RepID=D5EQ23_CORAD|nr:fatty acid synthase [Coraliomargarita akajimensis DSM 45221]